MFQAHFVANLLNGPDFMTRFSTCIAFSYRFWFSAAAAAAKLEAIEPPTIT
jgi:hypothetical protein